MFQMFNVLVGTAVFALPSAVHTTGWLAFILAQLLLAALSAATTFYLLHTMQVNATRPQTTAKDYDDHDKESEQQAALDSDEECDGQSRQQLDQSHEASVSGCCASEQTPLLSSSTASSSSFSSSSRGAVRPLPKSSALLGLPHLCSHYGGRWLFYVYEAGVILYLLFTLWGVAATFTGQASATVMALFAGQDCSMYNEATHSIASCQYAYYGSLALLSVAAVMWAVSGSPLSERVSAGAAILKLVGLVLITATVLVALLLGKGPVDDSYSSQSSTQHRAAPVAAIGAVGMLPSNGRMLKGVCLALVYAALSYNISFDMAAVFSPQQWQWWTGTGSGDQGRAHSNDSKPATRAALLVAVTIVATLLLYLVVGIVCAALFGGRAATLINLHWRQYEGMDFLSTTASPSTMISFYTPISLWARLLQVTILLVPIVAAVCSLPYLADAQSESLTRLISYNTEHPHSTFILYRSSPPSVPGGKSSIALLSVLPPLLLTAVVGDLGEIFLWTAPCALFIQYLLPAVLLLLTRYGPNAEPQYGDSGQSESDGRREWHLKPFVLIALLALSSLVSIITLTLLCLYPLW